MVVILNNIRSIYNVGSIFRTADAVSAKKIYLCGITPAPIDRFGLVNKALAKVALGAEKSVKWEKNSSTITVIDSLKKKGYIIMIIEQDKKSISLFDLPKYKLGKNIAIIMGSEVDGLSKAILKKADQIVEIPMLGKKESLNVSVAFGIVVYFVKYKS
ncbi:MAG: TrmH family RNA methyltransferase [Candidatus Falkowbacteria bacterium]